MNVLPSIIRLVLTEYILNNEVKLVYNHINYQMFQDEGILWCINSAQFHHYLVNKVNKHCNSVDAAITNCQTKLY